MAVYYDNKKIIPIPSVAINKQYIKNEDGQSIGSKFNITINGVIIAWKGSPDSTGAFWTIGGYPADEVIATDSRLAAILKKQQALRDLFSVDGRVLSFAPWDATQPSECNPRVISIDFPAGIWVETCPYTITLECDTITGPLIPTTEDDFAQYLNSAIEDWSINMQSDQPESDIQQQTFLLTHTLNAIGRRHYNADSSYQEGWEQARTWVQSRLGIDADRIIAVSSLNLPVWFNGYNHARAESVNKNNGNFSVTETWVVSSGTALEDFSIDSNVSTNDGLTTVTIQGNIRGLETRNSNFAISQTKWAAASGKFEQIRNGLYGRAQNYSGISLNPLAINEAIGRNPVAGTISYVYTYNSRFSLFPNARFQNIQITEQGNDDVFASLLVLGRTAGPVLQDISTVTARARSVNIELIVTPASSSGYINYMANKPDTNGIINDTRPIASQVFETNKSETFNPITGNYARTITFVYE
jgi:hypothetical protein